MLSKIQKELKAPKNQTNKFGGYKYRNCEDILEAVKPLLPEGVSIVLSDEMVAIGSRVYVRAEATLMADDNVYCSAQGWAREAENKKGMDDAQITGAASSYARKYALNGLFAIDDTKDADTTNDKEPPKPKRTKEQVDADAKVKYEEILNGLDSCSTDEQINSCVKKNGKAMGYMAKNYKHYHEDLVIKGKEVREQVKKGK